MKVKIPVRPQHIAGGIPTKPGMCAIALAAKDCFPRGECSVGPNFLTVAHFSLWLEWSHLSLGRDGQDFVRRYDRGFTGHCTPPEPTTLEVDIPLGFYAKVCPLALPYRCN